MATRPFFVPQQEINLFDALNEELIDNVIGQTVDIYKIDVENGNVFIKADNYETKLMGKCGKVTDSFKY